MKYSWKCTKSTFNLLWPPPSPLKEYCLYTQFNVDIFGRPLNFNFFSSKYCIPREKESKICKCTTVLFDKIRHHSRWTNILHFKKKILICDIFVHKWKHTVANNVKCAANPRSYVTKGECFICDCNCKYLKKYTGKIQLFGVYILAFLSNTF